MLQHFVPLMSEGSCHSCHSASNFAEIKAHALARSLWCIPLPLLQKAKTILLLCPVRIGLLCKKHAVKQDLSYTPGNCARMCDWHHQCCIHSDCLAALQDKYNGLSFTMERPRGCPCPFLCWPFNCTIINPLKMFVRSTDGERRPHTCYSAPQD